MAFSSAFWAAMALLDGLIRLSSSLCSRGLCGIAAVGKGGSNRIQPGEAGILRKS